MPSTLLRAALVSDRFWKIRFEKNNAYFHAKVLVNTDDAAGSWPHAAGRMRRHLPASPWAWTPKRAWRPRRLTRRT